MHPLLTSTALGLIAAWPVGALGLGLGRLVERLTDDPRPRAAAWSLAYALPAGALTATVALTFSPFTAPKPATTAAIVPGPVRMVMAERAANAGPASATPSWKASPILTNGLAWSLIGLSVAGLAARGWRWRQGRCRLAQVRAAAQPCQDRPLVEAVRLRAARLGVKAPRVRISAAIAEPMLAGARRPVILLPKALVETADTRELELVCGHELAHLRRGDNWRIPAEEALAGLFWLSPPVAALRGRMLAAREAVCDMTALDGAAPEARRDYARILVEALRTNALPAPRLAFESAFTGRERSLARMRLSAILQPRGSASSLRVAMVFALGATLVGTTGAGSLALAQQVRRSTPPEHHGHEAEAARHAAEAARATAVADAASVQDARAMAEAVAAAAETAPVRAEAVAVAVAAPAAEAAAPVAEPVAPVASAAPVQAAPAVAPRASPTPSPRPDPRPAPNPLPSFEARAVAAPDVAVRVETQPNVRIVLPRRSAEDLGRQIKVLDPSLNTRVTAAPKVAVDVSVRSAESPWDRH